MGDDGSIGYGRWVADMVRSRSGHRWTNRAPGSLGRDHRSARRVLRPLDAAPLVSTPRRSGLELLTREADQQLLEPVDADLG
jgi:hypothetical protein